MSLPENETDSQAWHWALLEMEGSLSTAQRCALQSWLADDSRHEGALVRARAACLYLAGVSAPARGGTAAAFDLSVRSTRRRIITGSLAAGAVIGLSTWIGRSWNTESGHETSYSSEVGQIRRVLLADGSELLLNTATEVAVRYAGTQREAVLIRGEAMFTVAQDALRPFFVAIGEWLLCATDTTFGVHLNPRDRVFAEITVLKGSPELRPSHSQAAQAPQRLAENQEAIVDASGSVELRAVTDQEAQRSLAWRTGMVVFEGESLREAVEQMNRYSRRKLAVSDPKLSARRIVGVFRATDTETFVSQLQSGWGVQAESSGDVVLLRPPVESSH